MKKWSHILPEESRLGDGVRMAVRVFAWAWQGTFKPYGYDNN
jgi:hypothetical protein